MLFRQVADLFLTRKPAAGGGHQDGLVDILTMLLPKVAVSVRRELAATLYSMTSPPLPLIRLLMNDVSEVAGPLLRHAPLTVDAIRALAPDAGPAARRLFMVRPDLPEDIRAEWQQVEQQAAAAPPAPPLASNAGVLRQRRNRFQDAVRAATDWQWETDRNGVLTFVSDSTARAFERPTAHMVGAPLMDLVAADDKPYQPDPLSHALTRLRPFDNLTVRPVARALTARRWRLAGVPVFDGGTGRFLGYRGTAQAIPQPTPPVPAATQAQQPVVTAPSGLDPAVMNALQTLSHEIRTPLNAILGFSEIVALGARGPLHDRYRNSAQEAVAAGWQLNKVIAQILECAPLLSRTRPPEIKMLSLMQAVRDALAALAGEAAEKAISLAITPDSVSPAIDSDGTALTLCLTNLLRRAVLESPAGSQIQVAIRSGQNNAVEIVIPLPGGDAAPQNSPLSKLYQSFAEELASLLQARIQVRPVGGPAQELRVHLPLTSATGSGI